MRAVWRRRPIAVRGGHRFGVLVPAAVLLAAASTPAAVSASAKSVVGPSTSSTSWRFPAVDSAMVPSAVHEVLVRLPASDTQFYAQNAAVLSFELTWSSSAPTELDLFAVGPASDGSSGVNTSTSCPSAPSCPNGLPFGFGRPDTFASGPNHETITLHDPRSGIWTVEVLAAAAGSTTYTVPTASEATASLAVSGGAEPDAGDTPETPGDVPYSVIDGVTVPLSPPGSLIADLYVPQTREPAPVVELVHGSATCSHLRQRLATFGRLLASRGLLAIVPDRRILVPRKTSCRGDSDPAQDAEDVLSVLRWATAVSSTAGNPLSGKVDPGRLGLFGHSGGALLVTAATVASQTEGPHLTAVVVSGSPTQQASGVTHCDRVPDSLLGPAITVPVAAVDNAQDVIPWPDTSAPADCTYNQLRGPKVGVMVNYSYHCEAEDPTPSFSACLGAGLPLGLQPANPVHQSLVRRYSAAWFEAWMQCDRDALPYLDGAGADADRKADLVTLLAGGSSPDDIASRLPCPPRESGVGAAGAASSGGIHATALPVTMPAATASALAGTVAGLWALLFVVLRRI